MRRGDKVIDLRRCLRAAVAVHALEIEGGNAMHAEGACEGWASIHRSCRVISHFVMVVLLASR
jgi:hypothetical protein